MLPLARSTAAVKTRNACRMRQSTAVTRTNPQNRTMLTWVVYDISDDKQRSKAAKACLRIGLYRVQKSVFLGTLENNELDELGLELESLIDANRDSVYLFPMCRPDFDKIVLLGQAFDEDLVTDQVRSLFA
jgi:CRISPR-associated protein Cas2